MKFTGSILFNCFEGDENRQPMTRAISRFGAFEYAVYLNQLEGGVIAAVHAVQGRNGNSPIIDKNALAMTVVDQVEGLEGIEFVIPHLTWDNVEVNDFAVSIERVNPNGNTFRLAMPLEIAKVRYNVAEKKQAAADGNAL